MLEEQQQAEYQRPLRQNQPANTNTNAMVGYGGGRHGQGSAPGSGAAGTGPGIEEQFNKFAESTLSSIISVMNVYQFRTAGKKTIMSLFGKAKQKMAEFEQSRSVCNEVTDIVLLTR